MLQDNRVSKMHAFLLGVKQAFFGPQLKARPGLHEEVKGLNQYIKQKVPKS